MSLRTLVILALVLAAVPVSAQNAGRDTTLTGSVRDETGAFVSGARIGANCGGVSREAESGTAGEFTLVGLPAGPCLLTADAPFFESTRLAVEAGRGGSTVLQLRVSGFASSVQVTATRRVREERSALPQGTSVTTRAEIDARPYQLLPQVLREEPGILVQQTTSAQASPVIRGFTGQSNVYLIDGVRFNQASWRSGPSQYLAFVNAGSVERLEVVRGPGSVQYGSDALGGTVNVLPARPTLTTAGVRASGDLSASFGSAEKSAAGDANLTVQGPMAAFRVGFSGRRVDDLRTGGGIDSHAAVTRFLGLSSRVTSGRLPNTGYDQAGGYVTGQVKAGVRGTVDLLYMHENQTGASRYDRIDGGNGLYRSGFDPQRLDFGLVRFTQRAALGFDSVSGTVSVNRQADGSFEQTRPTAVLDRQRSATTAVGYQAEGQRRLATRHLLSLGAELYDERVGGASRQQVNPVTGAVTPQRPDVPDGTTYLSSGVFAQDVVEFGRASVRGGLRYGHYAFSTRADSRFGVGEESVRTQALTFQAGTVVTVTRHLSATFNVSRGFRAPNASDLGSIGLTGGSGLSVTPSRAADLGGLVGSTAGTTAVSTGVAIPALGPEQLYAFEPGVRVKVGRLEGSITTFNLEYLDTLERRAIVFPTPVAGATIAGFDVVRQDASGLAYIAQDIRPIVTTVNGNRSRIRGFEAELSARVAERWTAYGYYSMSDGVLVATGEAMRRMTPPLGGARLRWSGARTWIEGVVTLARSQTKLHTGDLTDARTGASRTRASIASYFNGTATDLGLVRDGVLVATRETLSQVQTRVLGTDASGLLFTENPGYVVLGARAGFRIGRQLDMTVIGENLTDKNYRLHGSGTDAPGINLVVRTRVRF